VFSFRLGRLGYTSLLIMLDEKAFSPIFHFWLGFLLLIQGQQADLLPSGNQALSQIPLFMPIPVVPHTFLVSSAQRGSCPLIRKCLPSLQRGLFIFPFPRVYPDPLGTFPPVARLPPASAILFLPDRGAPPVKMSVPVCFLSVYLLPIFVFLPPCRMSPTAAEACLSLLSALLNILGVSDTPFLLGRFQRSHDFFLSFFSANVIRLPV